VSNKEYLRKVVYPYFSDIYDDLAQRSDELDKGIDKVTFLDVRSI